MCVVGGGPSGIAAAVACARHGADVFLVESQGCFGGAATLSLVPTFINFTNGTDFLAGGIGREIYDRCTTENPGCEFGKVVGYDVEKLKRLYDDMIVSAGVRFLFFANMIDVICRDGHVEAAVVSSKSGLYAVKARIFIDATGDGDLCARAGADFESGDENGGFMGATLCSIWEHIDWNDPAAFRDQSAELERAFADGVFTCEDRHLPGIFKQGETLGGGNIGHVFGVDPTKEEALTLGMVTGRKALPEFEKYYRNYIGGAFAKARPVATGSTLGIRESRRITGDYVLTVNDFKRRAVFDDEIGRFSYPIDVHESEPTKDAFDSFMHEFTTMVYRDGESYGIPYRCLLPRTLNNVYAVGKCISTDRKMLASTRVMPCCFITGQAAGTAAAIAVKTGKCDTRRVDVGLLQDKLAAMGGFLPNHKTQPTG